ncbi:MAG: hypothetical protein COA74_14245 [Gammaproteobacteria bacterium]|nr:MAG: hypothetical protein COA74_14245 [Gammaproteobacteria bacterium]
MMITILKTIVLFALLTTGFCSGAEVGNSYEIKVLSSFDPPNIYFDEKVQPAGDSLVKVKAFLEQSSLKFKISIVPWARAYRNTLTHNDTIIFNIARTPKREKLFHWLLPLSVFTNSLVSKNSSKYRNLTQQQIITGGYTAACIRESIHCQQLLDYGFKSELIKKTSNASVDDFTELLDRRRIDFVIINMTGMGKDKNAKASDSFDFYEHSIIDTTTAYLAAPIGLAPEILSILLALPQTNESR